MILFSAPILIIGAVCLKQSPVRVMIANSALTEGVLFRIGIVGLIVRVILKDWWRYSETRRQDTDINLDILFCFSSIFNVTWLIAGSVWIFGVKSHVQFDHS